MENTIQHHRKYPKTHLRLGFNSPHDYGIFLQHVEKLYLASPEDRKITIRGLCQKCREGSLPEYPRPIPLTEARLTTYLRRRGHTIRKSGGASKYARFAKTESRTISMDKDLIVYMDTLLPRGEGLPSVSRIMNAGCKIMFGIPTAEIVVFIPDQDERFKRVLFYQFGGVPQAIAFQELSHSERQMMSTWLKKARIDGLMYIKRVAESYGMKCFGGEGLNELWQNYKSEVL